MLCLLHLVLIVGRDELAENAQLLRCRSDDAEGSASSDAAVVTRRSGAGIAFSKLLTKLGKVGAAHGGSTTQGVRAGGAGGAAEEEEYVQWRVQVLQRIQLPLAVAYR